MEPTEPASLSIVLPIIVAAADESRDELQDLWAQLLAAAADPNRAKSFRLAFIEAAKKMDPLDALVLASAQALLNSMIDGQARNRLAQQLSVGRDEVDISVSNLQKLELIVPTNPPNAAVGPSGREFLRAVAN